MSYDNLTSADELAADVFEQWRTVHSVQMRITDAQGSDEYVMQAHPSVGDVFDFECGELGVSTKNWRGGFHINVNDYLVGSFTPEFRVSVQAMTLGTDPGGVALTFSLKELSSLANGVATVGGTVESAIIPNLTANDLLTAVSGISPVTTGFHLVSVKPDAPFAVNAVSVVSAQVQVRAQ